LDSSGHAALEVVSFVNPAGGNDTALGNLEELVEAVRAALRAASIGVHGTDQPRTTSDGGALSATTYTTLMVRC
jgi:hypothetical protein